MLEKLQLILREYLGDPSITISEDMLLLSDFDLDSLDLVTLVGKVEEAFSVEISDRAMMKMKTVGDLLRYLQDT
ncbi:MAG: acyl carrier protein [Oscillospiraceae bacterium]|nr:acyl carrier protein [Oscillospiraceae bacterium]